MKDLQTRTRRDRERKDACLQFDLSPPLLCSFPSKTSHPSPHDHRAHGSVSSSVRTLFHFSFPMLFEECVKRRRAIEGKRGKTREVDENSAGERTRSKFL